MAAPLFIRVPQLITQRALLTQLGSPFPHTNSEDASCGWCQEKLSTSPRVHNTLPPFLSPRQPQVGEGKRLGQRLSVDGMAAGVERAALLKRAESGGMEKQRNRRSSWVGADTAADEGG